MSYIYTEKHTKNTLVLIFLVLAIFLPWIAGAGQAGPNFTKTFVPDTIGPGSVSTLTFTIANFNPSPVEDLAFTDPLPNGVVIASPANASTTCTDGIVSAPDAETSISFSGGKVASSQNCIVSVDVTSSIVGTHTNVSEDLTSSEGSSGTATDDLNVVSTLPGFSKSFSPSTVNFGSRSTLTFTIDNTANVSALGSLNFTDNFPVGLVIADPANASTTCGGQTPTLIASAGTSIVSFSSFGSLSQRFRGIASGG